MKVTDFNSICSLGIRVILLGAVAGLLSQCMSSPRFSRVASRYAVAPSAQGEPEAAGVAKSRPGLGTQLGDELRDSSSAAVFYRKPDSVPDAVGRFFYNDQEGAELMAKLEGGRVRKQKGEFELIPGKLSVAVLNGTWDVSNTLHYFRSDHGIYVIGTPGNEYSLKVRNCTSNRIEVVVSVDGLSLLDGQPASVKKSGYIIPAKASVILKGMRVNNKLHALQFGTVSQSRAATAFGEKAARNVGVVGVAYYEEDEQARRRANVKENYLRQGARAFDP